MKHFFTSDIHFWHKGIIEHCNRPFKDVQDMNEGLIKNWNNKVGDNDCVYILGDLSFAGTKATEDIVCRLKGRKHLIRGNHDKGLKEHMALRYFEWIKDYYVLKIQDQEAFSGVQRIVLFHYAMKVWDMSHYGAWHLYGHSHGTLPDDPNSLSFDVGVDCHQYSPISYDEVKQIMSKKSFKPVDHHRGIYNESLSEKQ